MAVRLELNGVQREFAEDLPNVAALVAELGFRVDRVALEKNGEIVPRTTWADTSLEDGDKIELVHFVGGGCFA